MLEALVFLVIWLALCTGALACYLVSMEVQRRKDERRPDQGSPYYD